MPVRLPIKPLEKVWGSPKTEPWYGNPGENDIGEVWFLASDSTPLLVKFLFTSANLSVQVHPGDDYAREHALGSPGKTEMWHVLRAETGARLAIGPRQEETKQSIRVAAENGYLAELLNWVETKPGDTFFIPAGTIHAVGAGLVLCEVQQPSDITYRLFDFGRGRELHLDESLEVAILKPYNAKVTLPFECPFFSTELLSVRGTASLPLRPNSYLCIVLSGQGTLASQPFQAGEGWEIAAGEGRIAIESPNAALLIASVMAKM